MVRTTRAIRSILRKREAIAALPEIREFWPLQDRLSMDN